MKQTGTDRRKGDGIFLVLLFIETKGSCYCLALSSLIPRPKSSFPSFAWFPGNWISRERDLFRLLRWSMKSTQSVQLNNIWRCVRPKKPVIHILWKTNKYNHEWHPTYFDASSLKLLIQAQICALEGVGFNCKASTGKIPTYWIQVVANKRCKCLENRISKVNIACSRLRDGSQNQISSLATQTVKHININDTSASWPSQKTWYTKLNNKNETQQRMGWRSVQYGAIIGQIKHHTNSSEFEFCRCSDRTRRLGKKF